MANKFSDADLESYLDETLHPDLAAELEQLLKKDKQLIARLSHINSRRDAGVHTLGEIWRRNQIGVPTREQMTEFLNGTLDSDHADYIRFRLEVLKCRYTIAQRDDLASHSGKKDQPQSANRRRKYFDSSANLLQKKKNR
jgi:hypothetical protein